MKITLLTLCLYFTSFFFACEGVLEEPCPGPYVFYGSAEWTGMELYLNDQDSIVLNEYDANERTMYSFNISMNAKVEMQSEFYPENQPNHSQVAAFACPPSSNHILPTDSLKSLHLIATRNIFDTIRQGDTLDCYDHLIRSENQNATLCDSYTYLHQQFVSLTADKNGYLLIDCWLNRELAKETSSLRVIVETKNKQQYQDTL